MEIMRTRCRPAGVEALAGECSGEAAKAPKGAWRGMLVILDAMLLIKEGKKCKKVTYYSLALCQLSYSREVSRGLFREKSGRPGSNWGHQDFRVSPSI